MLILTRRIGETLVIGEGPDKIDITILGINGNQVRIGTQAPKSVPVNRQEIYNLIQVEKKAKEKENEERNEEDGGSDE